MIKNIKQYGLILILMMLLAGCASTITWSRLDKLQIDTPRSEVLNTMKLKPSRQLIVRIKHKTYYVDVYYFKNGVYSSNYFLAYNAQKRLIYWGYPNEFAREQNKLLNQIAAKALVELG